MTDQKTTEATSFYASARSQVSIFKRAGPAQNDVQSNALEYEDEFKSAYGAGVGIQDWRGAAGVQIIQPAILPKTLQGLVQQNNSLPQCIEAFVTNVHETGYDLALRDPAPVVPGQKVPVDSRIATVAAFLDEVWPGMSFHQLRTKTGEDQESSGNAYWEFLRNRKGELLMIRPLETKLTRMVMLSKEYDASVTVRRGGKDITLRMPMRYRRFVQSVGTSFVFYKEYGCPLLINKFTGELMENLPENRLKLYRTNAMGTEVMHFKAMDDVDTPYGVPRWVSQMPSVLGSRKAEEHNLDYFEAGGVPPIMIFIQGGVAGPTMKTALEEFLSSKPGAKQGAPVFEILSTGGSLDSPGVGAKVTVEKFGSEQQKDSMFEAYDDKCEERVRRAWRLPPIFVGKSQDYNLATAQASYAVAEAQVFRPERDEFDSRINSTLMRELDPTGQVVLRSRGLPVKDVNQQLLAIQTAMTAGALDVAELVRLLNEITSMNMEMRATAAKEQEAAIQSKLDLAAAVVEVTKNPPKNQNANGPSSSSPKPKASAKKADMVMEELMHAMTTGEGSLIASIVKDLVTLPANEMAIFKARLQPQAA